MKRETAKKVTDLLLRHGKEQDDLLAEIKNDSNEDDFIAARKTIAKTMGSIYLDCLQPVFAEHPDLRPKELRSI